MLLILKAKQIWRDFVTDGIPGSGPWNPKKSDMRVWGTDIEERAGKFIFPTRADAVAAEIPAQITSIELRGLLSVGDGLGGLYIPTNNGSTDTFISADGRTWYRAADVGEVRFSGDTLSMWRYTLAKYRKRIHKELPIRGPGYASILTNDGLSFLIPQAFTVDWNDGLLYINCSGDIAGGHLWVRVHDFWTGAHITTFGTQMGAGQNYSEGIVVKREGDARKLYIQTDLDAIGRFDITNLPTHLATVTPEATYLVGLHSQFDYRAGKFLVQQRVPSLGAENRRNNFALYNEALNSRIGTLMLSNADAGPWTSSALADYIPKIQTMQIGDGFYLASCGGFHARGNASIPYSYQGVKLFNSDGVLLDENLIDPELLASTLAANGYICDKIEYEGAAIAPDGRIFSLCLTISNGNAASANVSVRRPHFRVWRDGAIGRVSSHRP